MGRVTKEAAAAIREIPKTRLDSIIYRRGKQKMFGFLTDDNFRWKNAERQSVYQRMQRPDTIQNTQLASQCEVPPHDRVAFQWGVLHAFIENIQYIPLERATRKSSTIHPEIETNSYHCISTVQYHTVHFMNIQNIHTIRSQAPHAAQTQTPFDKCVAPAPHSTHRPPNLAVRIFYFQSVP